MLETLSELINAEPTMKIIIQYEKHNVVFQFIHVYSYTVNTVIFAGGDL